MQSVERLNERGGAPGSQKQPDELLRTTRSSTKKKPSTKKKTKTKRKGSAKKKTSAKKRPSKKPQQRRRRTGDTEEVDWTSSSEPLNFETMTERQAEAWDRMSPKERAAIAEARPFAPEKPEGWSHTPAMRHVASGDEVPTLTKLPEPIMGKGKGPPPPPRVELAYDTAVNKPSLKHFVKPEPYNSVTRRYGVPGHHRTKDEAITYMKDVYSVEVSEGLEKYGKLLNDDDALHVFNAANYELDRLVRINPAIVERFKMGLRNVGTRPKEYGPAWKQRDVLGLATIDAIKGRGLSTVYFNPYHSTLLRKPSDFASFARKSGTVHAKSYEYESVMQNTFRHELAHALTTPADEGAWFRAMQKAIDEDKIVDRKGKTLALDAFSEDDIRTYVSNRISPYGATNWMEGIAEATARYTAPNYKKGEMHASIEKFIERLLNRGATDAPPPPQLSEYLDSVRSIVLGPGKAYKVSGGYWGPPTEEQEEEDENISVIDVGGPDKEGTVIRNDEDEG